MTRKLLFPSEREEAKSCFAYFFDFEFQKGWFDSNYKHAFWDSLNYYALDYLFDGTPHLYDEDYECVGVCIYNKEETDIMFDYLDFFKEHFDAQMPDDYYVNHPKWPEFTRRAQEIVKMMEENEEKYNFKGDLEDYYTELDKERRKERTPEIMKIIEETDALSLEAKQELKGQLLECSDEEFREVANSVAAKVWALKEHP